MGYENSWDEARDARGLNQMAADVGRYARLWAPCDGDCLDASLVYCLVSGSAGDGLNRRPCTS